jgi:hypothetical protein
VDGHLAPVAVVDIDGVVADVRHRVGRLERRPPDWAGFFSAADRDQPLSIGVARVHDLVAAGYEVVWLTGRPEWLRDVTEQWLDEQGLPVGMLLMRPNYDRRPARVLKASVVRALASGRGLPGYAAGAPRDIALILDDDLQVVERLRADGWPVERAEWVGPANTRVRRLHDAQEREGRT